MVQSAVMSSAACTSAVAARPARPCRSSARPFVGLHRHAAVFRAPTTEDKFKAVAKSVKPSSRSATALQSTSAMEVFQLAGEGGEIAGVAAVMFAITLVGLAFGFVLLRVESLVEEGKI